jgi:transposase
MIAKKFVEPLKPGKYLTAFERKILEQSLERETQELYRKRLHVMLQADVGLSQSQICLELGCSRSTVRFWMTMVRSGNALRWNDSGLGRPKTADEKVINHLVILWQQSPRNYGYDAAHWRGKWLRRLLIRDLDVQLSVRHINRLLRKMGLATRKTSLKQKENKSHIIAIDDLPSA